ncbi:DNA polymerase III PolC-type [Geobacter sp. OR-1]|uniref:3'-5' exonuclease n=1 Tax=Geobacter sp. OR-1 TaxID=1266765 RepID=UPI000541ACD9|nr:3'-5' exonuclease [Geobacter sp. OR-1]GAM10344.1 DNA polymerase III PolC-type [Geobacter sp. OR-1]
MTTDSSNAKVMIPVDVETAINALIATGSTKISRKVDLDSDPRFTRKSVNTAKTAICLDVETTGLNYTVDKAIEVGIVAFEFDPDTADIIRVVDRYSGFEDPCRPITAEITALTGITDEMVRGKFFDDGRVNHLANTASLVIAHNAGFDRKFVEERFPSFNKLPWACSIEQIDWKNENFSTRTLEYLLFKFGLFVDAHRALNDAEGVLGILLGKLPVSNRLVFRSLLDRHLDETTKIWAVGAPFDKKDLLKQRNYRWNDGTDGRSKAWWTTIPCCQEKDELCWLAKEIYQDGKITDVEVFRVSAQDRFSVRER